MANGATLEGIVAAAKARCGDGKKRPDQSAEEALAVAAENIAENQGLLGSSYDLFRVVNGIVTTLGTILNIIPNPVARILGRGAIVARTQVAAQQNAITAQRSANDRAYTIVQQAAANERAFMIRVGAR